MMILLTCIFHNLEKPKFYMKNYKTKKNNCKINFKNYNRKMNNKHFRFKRYKNI